MNVFLFGVYVWPELEFEVNVKKQHFPVLVNDRSIIDSH